MSNAIANDNRLTCWSVTRDPNALNAVTVTFNRTLSAEELIFFDEVCRRSACLMDDRIGDET